MPSGASQADFFIQGDVDWAAAVGNGASFAYVKAFEGSTSTNPNFAQQYNGS